MAAVLKVRKLGNSLAVILPKDQTMRMRVGEGDELYATATADGLELSPFDPDFEMKINAFDRTRRKFRNALRELAR